MNHVRVALVFAMLLAFGAGAVIGIGRTRSASRGEESSFSRQLHLTPQQETQIREIWSKMLEGGPREDRRRADLREQRDAQIAAFLTAEQRAKYQQIQSEYQTGIHSIEADRDAAFASAEEKTRDLLTPEQAKKFDEMMHHGGPHPGMGPLPGPPPFMDEHHPHGPPPSGF
jgi:Spy/CpxP family protein refolding chaperone